MKKILYIGNQLSKHNVSPTTIDVLSKLLVAEGFRVYTASKKKNKLLRLIDMVFMTLKYKKKIDFVLIDTYSTKAFWFAYLIGYICNRSKLKYIPILHGGDLVKRLNQNPNICNQFFGNSHKNVAPSIFHQKTFVQRGFSQTIVIPNFIDTENYKFKLRQQIKPHLLWVRALANIYQPKLAIDVLVALKKKFPQATLTMVGAEKDISVNELLQYAKEKQVEIVLTGYLPKHDWIKLADEHDVFINTSMIDNMPVTIIEAMTLGLVVVSTNVGGLGDLVFEQHNGILINDFDSQKFVFAIESLITNETYSKRIICNAKQYAEAYSWSKVKLMWLQLFTENH